MVERFTANDRLASSSCWELDHAVRKWKRPWTPYPSLIPGTAAFGEYPVLSKQIAPCREMLTHFEF